MSDTLFDPDYRNGRHRTPDWTTSVQGANAVAYRAGSQKAKLLDAYKAEYPYALTDEDAAMKAGIPLTSCYWKRCGELREDGWITPAKHADGSQMTLTGYAGVQRIACTYNPNKGE